MSDSIDRLWLEELLTQVARGSLYLEIFFIIIIFFSRLGLFYLLVLSKFIILFSYFFVKFVHFVFFFFVGDGGG